MAKEQNIQIKKHNEIFLVISEALLIGFLISISISFRFGGNFALYILSFPRLIVVFIPIIFSSAFSPGVALAGLVFVILLLVVLVRIYKKKKRTFFANIAKYNKLSVGVFCLSFFFSSCFPIAGVSLLDPSFWGVFVVSGVLFYLAIVAIRQTVRLNQKGVYLGAISLIYSTAFFGLGLLIVFGSLTGNFRLM